MNVKATHKEKLADGKTIGGRGRLSDSVIKKIQRCYGFAIRQNVLEEENATEKQKEISIYSMKKNIIGILHHMINKKDLAQQYLYGPRGSESWCAWQRDVAGDSKYTKTSQGVLPIRRSGGAWPQNLPLKFLLEPQILPPKI